MKEIKRAYSYKDVDMLTAAQIVVSLAIQKLTDLLPYRPHWANPYFPNLATRIDNAFINFLGLDPKKDLRAATAIVLGIFEPASYDLAFFKTQIMVDFENNKPRRDEILKVLGFTQLLKLVQSRDQEALVELLYRFKQNMTPALQTEITTAGMAPALITNIKAYADTLKNANITQELFKKSTMIVTETAIQEFNEIYKIIIGVCKIAAKIFQNDPLLKSQCSFSGIIKKLNVPPPEEEPTPPPSA